MKTLLQLFCLIKEDNNPIGLTALREPDLLSANDDIGQEDDDDLRWLKLIRD